MPLIDFDAILPLMACPRCRSRLDIAAEGLTCVGCTALYVRTRSGAGCPILIDSGTSVVDTNVVLRAGEASLVDRSRGGSLLAPLRAMVSPRNTTAERCVQKIADELSGNNRRPRVLVVGGGSVGNGVENLYRDDRLDVIAFDIYPSSNVQFVADAHRIPLQDGSVDGVVIQAVLEHVLEPAVVVAEIHRVLSRQGVVYSDTPFMQQVHEGPYDFTRFTESGHRYLFRDFEEIQSGLVAGLGTQLRWSLDYFARGMLRNRWAGTATRMLFFWLSYLDRFASRAHSIDGASSVFFLGRRTETRMTPREAVVRYSGAQ
jgi:SAM-dependent methyltransferase